LLGALAAFSEFYVRSGILVYGDAAQTAHNIVASERLFRIGIATDLFGGACNAVLAVAFYTMLKQVNSRIGNTNRLRGSILAQESTRCVDIVRVIRPVDGSIEVNEGGQCRTGAWSSTIN